MTALDDAEAALRDARNRGDTRSIHAAQIALRLAVRQDLRDDKRRRQEQRAAEAQAEERRERSRRPHWWPWRRA